MPTSTEMYRRARIRALTLISAGLGLTNRQFLLPNDEREWREFAIWLTSIQWPVFSFRIFGVGHPTPPRRWTKGLLFHSYEKTDIGRTMWGRTMEEMGVCSTSAGRIQPFMKSISGRSIILADARPPPSRAWESHLHTPA